MKTTRAKPLPNKLYKLLRIAVDDAEKLDSDPRFNLAMGTWISKIDDGPCNVCLAGAVMVCELNALKNKEFRRTLEDNGNAALSPHDVTTSRKVAEKLEAIDDMRAGRIRAAAYTVLGKRSAANRFFKELSSAEHLVLGLAESAITDNYMSDIGRAPWEDYRVAADLLEMLDL